MTQWDRWSETRGWESANYFDPEMNEQHGNAKGSFRRPMYKDTVLCYGFWIFLDRTWAISFLGIVLLAVAGILSEDNCAKRTTPTSKFGQDLVERECREMASFGGICSSKKPPTVNFWLSGAALCPRLLAIRKIPRLWAWCRGFHGPLGAQQARRSTWEVVFV